jgi:hypothetical protein
VTAGQQNLIKQIEQTTVRHSWLGDLVRIGLYVLNAVLIIGAGIILPWFAVAYIAPVDPGLARGITALVIGGWAWTGFVYARRWGL